MLESPAKLIAFRVGGGGGTLLLWELPPCDPGSCDGPTWEHSGALCLRVSVVRNVDSTEVGSMWRGATAYPGCGALCRRTQWSATSR